MVTCLLTSMYIFRLEGRRNYPELWFDPHSQQADVFWSHKVASGPQILTGRNMFGALWIVGDFWLKSIHTIEKKKWKFPGCFLCCLVSFQDGRYYLGLSYFSITFPPSQVLTIYDLAEIFSLPLLWCLTLWHSDTLTLWHSDTLTWWS